MLNTGIVSNCWNFYLQNGVKLRELVAHAADLQMRDIAAWDLMSIQTKSTH